LLNHINTFGNASVLD